MRHTIALLRSESTARWFFAALAQSSLGTGAAYVALLVVAYDRFHSAWAISLVLLADFVPAMLLAPLFGAAADRWSRRWCAVVADVVRALAFVGLAVVGSFGATLALALLAGIGTALFRPAALAALPTLAQDDRPAAATALYGALNDLGFVLGPALAALALLALGPEQVLVANGATFALSAAVLCRLRFGVAPTSSDAPDAGGGRSLLTETRDGVRAIVAMQGIRVIVAASATAMLFGGIYNVVELPFATDALGSTAAGYSALSAVYGLGFVVGSLRGADGGGPSRLKRGYLQGIVLTGAGGLVMGLSPTLAPAVAGFALAGFGNGLLVVHERLLLQSEVASRLHGRAFGVIDWLAAWGFAVGFLAGGALIALGAREVMLVNAAGEMVLAGVAVCALRRHWMSQRVAAPAVRVEAPQAAEA